MATKLKEVKLSATDGVPQMLEAAVRDSWTYDDVIAHATKAKERDEQTVAVMETIKAFPLDAAWALYRAIERQFGIAEVEGRQSWFGKEDVAMIAVQTGPGERDRIMIPWGTFPLPAGGGIIEIAAGVEDGVQVLRIRCKTRRKFERAVKELIQRARDIVASESLYRSKALRLVFREGFMSGEFADVKFMDLRGVDRNDLVFSRNLQQAIDTNILTPIRFPQACAAAGVPQKRGVVIAGPYGVGKTMLALVTAQIATENGVTYIYLEDVERLPDALAFAQQYAPAIVFAEDIDRVAGERDDKLNNILNSLDGIDTKSFRVMTILSTNHVEKIHPALLRPGRTDVLLNVLPPDAEAVERLIRKYSRDRLPVVEDITAVCDKLAGQIPAVIREVVERAKLAAITRTLGDAQAHLVADDLDEAAYTVLQQRDLVEGKHVKELTEHESACSLLGKELGSALGGGIRDAATTLLSGVKLAPTNHRAPAQLSEATMAVVE